MSNEERLAVPAAAAQLPPALPEWDPRWSRLVTVDTERGRRTFHVLDTGRALADAGLTPTGTIVALHGNPTWSYMWRRLAQAAVDAAASAADAGHTVWRVIAPDQLDMGYSERLEHAHLPTPHDGDCVRMAQRIADFGALIDAVLGEDAHADPAAHPLVTVGHDWGGVLSLAWAARNEGRVSAAITLNTAVHQPEGAPVPAPLRAALAGPLLPGSTVLTDAFIRTTLRLSRSITPELRRAYRSPYATTARRGGVGGFVADIPIDEHHPSYAELQRIGCDIAAMTVPALILWGPKDPVFLERYLRDLRERLPHADVHRFEKTSHLFVEDVDYAGVILQWLEATLAQPREGAEAAPAGTTASAEPAAPAASAASTPADDGEPRFVFTALDERRHERAIASVDMSRTPPQAVSWAQLAGVVDAVAEGLRRLGLKRGDRVSLLVEPGNNLTAAAYAVLKAGGVVVVADAGLGPAGMTRAIRSADPQWIIGETPGLSLARAGGWPGRRISVHRMGRLRAAALGVEASLTSLSRTAVRDRDAFELPDLDDDAAVLFTSGSTGPAKGVRYTHRGLAALMRVLGDTFSVAPGAGLVAGFAPFALLGPGLGATSVTPRMSVTEPATLTAGALADAVAWGECTMVFASPAAYANVVATADALTHVQREALARVELALSAGAPVPTPLMRSIAEVFPHAEVHSPYGMTEGLLLTDIDLPGAEAAEREHTAGGVCVGTPIPGVTFALAPLDAAGVPAEATNDSRELSEFVVSAAHLKAGYDRLWKTDADSRRDGTAGENWHRTGDIGRIDERGRVWIEGRVQHVITGPTGPIGPGAVESALFDCPGVGRCAAVGVGPVGTQALVVVLEPDRAQLTPGAAPLEVADAVRTAVAERLGLDVAAVLVAPEFPTDIRHNSKIDRTRLARWAARVLAGGRIGRRVS